MAELPWSWPLDDAVYYAHPGTLRRPSEVATLWMEEFDAAYALTGAFMLVCHPRYSGRPARILALERLLEHIQRHDGVWFARCDEVAEHIRASAATPRHAAPAVLRRKRRESCGTGKSPIGRPRSPAGIRGSSYGPCRYRLFHARLHLPVQSGRLL